MHNRRGQPRASRLYGRSLYRFDTIEPSCWEASAGEQVIDSPVLASDCSCDVVIVGGGYTGLSAAYHLEKQYQIDVRVLEAGHLGWGASGRNGGFCSLGGSESGAHRNYAQLTRRLRQLWPAWQEVPIDYQWQGLVCFSRRLTPAIGRLSDDPSVFFGFGYHGNGVNTATWAGRELAGWLAQSEGNSVPDSIPQMVVGMSERFPLAAIRLWYLRARLAMMRAADQIAILRS